MKTILISGIVLLSIGIALYFVGINYNIIHLTVWAPELGGAGAVSILLGLLSEAFGK